MKSLILILALLLNGALFSQSPKSVPAKLQKATVYLSGAHLFYAENVNLLAGNNELVFENISPNIKASSLQASSRGGVVTEVKHLLKYKEKKVVTRKYDREIELVLDSMEELNFELKDITNKQTVLTTEKNMLLNNRIIKGQPLRDSLALLRDGMAFLKEKLNLIYDQELKLERSKNKVTKIQTKLNTRYNELVLLQSGQADYDPSTSQPTHQVIVTVFSEVAGTAQINFNYFVNQASWVPVYDLQATSTTNNFQLKYFANVSQNTGLNWNSVPLTLSTSNPSENNIKPSLNPWYLGYVLHKQSNALSNARKPLVHKTEALNKGQYPQNEDLDDAKSLTDYIQVTENLIRTEYEIKLNYTINADGKAHKVLISQREVPMLLEFATVPKLCADAFLMAKVTGWEDMNIIPGNARLYFDGGYVGEMYLTAPTTNDTLAINLGRDKSIAITRKKIKEKSKEKFIGDEKVDTRTIELVVRNTKNMPVQILVEDQIPVVQGTEEIKVTLIDGDGAELDIPSGTLNWKLKLNSKETKKIVFTYEIKYPKSKPIAGM